MTAGGKRKVVKDRDYLKLFSKDGEDALTEKELSEIIEEELSKPEEEMNAELIESCLDEINRLKKSETKGEDTDEKLKNRRIIKWLTAAAAIAAVFVITLSVWLNVQKPNPEVENNAAKEVYSVLEKSGYGSAKLPEALFTKDCDILSVKAEKSEEDKTSFLDSTAEEKIIKISFVYKEKNCTLTVGKKSQPIDGEKLTLPELSGTGADVYRSDGGYTAVYKSGGNYYVIQMPISISQLIEFIKTR